MRTAAILGGILAATLLSVPADGACLSAKQVRASGGHPKHHTVKGHRCWHAAGHKRVHRARRHHKTLQSAPANVTIGFAAEAPPATMPVMWGEFLPQQSVSIWRFAEAFELRKEPKSQPDIMVPEKPTTAPFKERFPAIETKSDEHLVAKASAFGVGLLALLIAMFPRRWRWRRKFKPIMPIPVKPLEIVDMPSWLRPEYKALSPRIVRNPQN